MVDSGLPALVVTDDDYQRLGAAADQIDASTVAIQQAVDDLGSRETRSIQLVRRCLATDLKDLGGQARELRWILEFATLTVRNVSNLQSVANSLEYMVDLWRRRDHLGNGEWLADMDALRAVLYRESGLLLLDAGWIHSLVRRQPAAAVAPDQSMSGWDVARLCWSVEQLNSGVANLRALAAQSAVLAGERTEQPRHLADVASTIDAAMAVLNDLVARSDPRNGRFRD
jgi:hypothetical protein